MQKIISEPVFSRHFAFDEGFGISTIGYHDFSRYYVPEFNSRVQNFYTLHFVLSGKGTLKTGGKTYNISEGQMFFLPPNTEICYYPTQEEPWEYVWFAFSRDEIAQYSAFAGFSANAPVSRIKNFEKTKYILKKLFDKLLLNECGHFKALSAFFDILEQYNESDELTGIKLVKKLIDENFASAGFNIEQLCRDVNISHSHLLRLFKKEYDITLVKYIISKRIDLACELLCTTDLSVSSVAFSCGFTDEIHFMKSFKKATGYSATKFRKQHTAS